MRRIGLVSSGTGGHLWPAVAIGRALERAGYETALLTEGREVERDLLASAGAEADYLPCGGSGPAAAWRLARAVFGARRWLREREVDALVLTGGRTALAAGLAGRSRGVPLYLLEQNVVRGRSNRVLTRFADRVYTGLPSTHGEGSERGRTVYTGTPLREEFGPSMHLSVPVDDDRRSAREALGLPLDRVVVFVTGGSQGAGSLNAEVPAALAPCQARPFALHLAGPGRSEQVRRLYAEHGVQAKVFDLHPEMATCYRAADLVICRGGGVTVAELIATARPAVVVPYPHHKDRQQWHNGRVLEARGAARIVEEDGALGASPATAPFAERLRAAVTAYVDDAAQRQELILGASSLERRDATEVIVQDLCERELTRAHR